MTNFARIINNTAVDVSADPAGSFHPSIAADFVKVPDQVRQQWRLVDGTWTEPAPQVAPPDSAGPTVTWADAPAEYWWIDVGPFFDRFGSKALAITSSEDNVVRGLMNLILPRKYVDLKREDLPTLLAILVSKSLLTVDDAKHILGTPTTEDERYIKGLPQPAAE